MPHVWGHLGGLEEKQDNFEQFSPTKGEQIDTFHLVVFIVLIRTRTV